MKKRITFLLTALFAVASLWAQEFQSGELMYRVISSGDDGNAVEVTYGDYGSLTDITIPEAVEYEGVKYSVTSIGYGAFEECTSLTSINIPESVTSIGELAFDFCLRLTSIVIPDGVTRIGISAFSETGLTSIFIPEGVTRIEEHTFAGSINLTSINIPESVTYIGKSAFDACLSLTSINIPENVTSIEDDTFGGCANLASINIPENVTSIGDGAFSTCESLTTINIPENVTSIGKEAFSYCTSLASMTVKATVPPTLEDQIGVSPELPIYVPIESVSAYMSAEYWKDMNIMGYNTGIDGIISDKADMTTRKVLQDGKVIIRKADKTYDLNGVEMK